MATKKKSDRSSRVKSKGDKSVKKVQNHDGVLRTNDVVAEQASASDDFVAAIPHNSNKALEHGHDNAVAPPPGANATVASLDRVRVDASDQPLTTNQGVPVGDNQNTLKAGLRGPSLLEDFILREKVTHFDHERIVHARGSAAHGYFEAYDALTKYTRAAPFAEKGKTTPVFVRFSTVAGERGSKDTARDVRGFAVKFYTDEGNWDLVGNNNTGVLHSGCDEVSRSDPCRQAGTASRHATSGVCA